MKEVTYSDLLPSLQKLKKECKQQHYIILSEKAETELEKVNTFYNIIIIC